MFCLIKPFEWQFPCFIYSKDPYLLESPFPIIAGVSRQLFLKNCQEALDQEDRFVFDLDRGEVYANPTSLSKIKFFEDPERCSEIRNYHQATFNNAESHIFELDKGKIVPHSVKGLAEELPDDPENLDNDKIREYVLKYRSLLFTTLIDPISDSKISVSCPCLLDTKKSIFIEFFIFFKFCSILPLSSLDGSFYPYFCLFFLFL